jgi:ADP-ribose pyrophosphatase YjhB (NUDIX family)
VSLTPAFHQEVPAGEDRPRDVCDHCGFIRYVNPLIVVGSVVAWSPDGPAFGPAAVPLDRVRILLCRRAILPRRGYWTLPAGYMETGETVAEAARREAREEACADLVIDGVLALYDVANRSQVQIMHRATLAAPDVAAGPESLDAVLFWWADIPWKSLAFHSVRWALEAFEASRLDSRFPPFGNPPGT